MHGMVFGELKKFVDKNLGGDSWKTLLKEAGLASRTYVPIKAYPDKEILSLVGTASKITGLKIPALLTGFGEFIAPNLLLLFRRQIKGDWNVMDLLENIETTIHNVVRLRNPGAKPPQLRCERISPEHVVIHYTSTRRLCHLGVGLATGIANQFGDPFTIEQTTCMLHDDDSCQISIKLDIPIQQATLFSSLKLTGSESAATSTVTDYVEISPDNPPIVIVGSGPVGIHAARKIIEQAPQNPLIIYGAEPWEPYNRVRLSELLAGEVEWDDISNKLDIPPDAAAHLKINSAITAIDRKNKYVVDAAGNKQHYSKLILAMGSRARRVDEHAKLSLSGVYAYRDVDDAQDLMTNVVQSENTIVTGGGVLGIEVAFALKAQNPNAEVTILHRRDYLMNQQLDEEAADFLLKQVHAEGIKVIFNTNISDFIGQNEIESIKLSKDHKTIPCDTLISCTGIVPNIDVASDAELKTKHGIQVDDFLQTNDPDIYAIGECMEHRGKTYGLIGPGLEQAKIAVDNILQDNKYEYTGTTISMRVKIKHLPIFSIKKNGLEEHSLKKIIFEDEKAIKFREVLLQKGVLVGATTIGDWPEVAQIQEAVDNGMKVHPWHHVYFSLTGSLFPIEGLQNPVEWPDSTMVCTCNAVSRGELGRAIAKGCSTVKELSESTGAALGCGNCKPLLAMLTGGGSYELVAPPLKGALLIFMSIALLLLTGLALPAFTLPVSIRNDNILLPFLFDSGWRQVSGYIVLGFMLLSFVLSLNKRWTLFKFASYNFWRVVHVALLAVAVGVLMLHTNLGLGQGFNLQLMVVFILSMMSGTSLGLLVILEGGFFGAILRNTRTFWLRSHILIIWVLFALILTHIVSVYYF